MYTREHPQIFPFEKGRHTKGVYASQAVAELRKESGLLSPRSHKALGKQVDIKNQINWKLYLAPEKWTGFPFSSCCTGAKQISLQSCVGVMPRNKESQVCSRHWQHICCFGVDNHDLHKGRCLLNDTCRQHCPNNAVMENVSVWG